MRLANSSLNSQTLVGQFPVQVWCGCCLWRGLVIKLLPMHATVEAESPC